MPRLLIALGCVTLMACGTIVDEPPASTTITGTERIAWDQPAADAVELATLGYVIYVDGTRTPLTDVSCAAAASAAGFACSARLPPLSRGSHTLYVASFVKDGDIHESARSAPLHVTVAQVAGSTALPRGSAPTTRNSAPLPQAPASTSRSRSRAMASGCGPKCWRTASRRRPISRSRRTAASSSPSVPAASASSAAVAC